MLRFPTNLGLFWSERPLLERIDAAAAAGVRAIELHWPYDVPAEQVKERCQRHSLALLGTCAATSLPARTASARCRGGRRSSRRLWTSRWPIAAPPVASRCTACGRRAAGTASAGTRRVRGQPTSSLGPGGDRRHYLLLEPLNPRDSPNYFYSTVEEGGSVLAEIGCDNIKLVFDCYHVGQVGGEVIASLERLLSIIGHVQIAAVPERAEPDRDKLDYRTVFAALQRLPYTGWTGCEYQPVAATDAGLSRASSLASIFRLRMRLSD